MIRFLDRCHFMGGLRCGWAAGQRSVGEDSVVSNSGSHPWISRVSARHEGEDVGRHATCPGTAGWGIRVGRA